MRIPITSGSSRIPASRRYIQEAEADSAEVIGSLIDSGELGEGGGFTNFSSKFRSRGTKSARLFWSPSVTDVEVFGLRTMTVGMIGGIAY